MQAKHEFPPFVLEDSTLLILGSFPSVKSRELGFYYMHKQNRFWKVLAKVFKDEYPSSLDEKKAFLKKHKIALYDVIDSCEIVGSKDATIKKVVPTKLDRLILQSQIARIYTTGSKAQELYQKYQEKELEMPAIALPSTSALNAAYQEEDLEKAYSVLKEKVLEKMVAPLLLWYQNSKRDLPWRKTKDPYAIWISEIMLQQTRVDKVLLYYQRFLTLFPDIASLANAREDRLFKAWEGLGYYTRAKNLKKAAQVIVEKYQGIFPREYEKILALPGVGSYTAGAITSIAFHEPNPAVDGNAFRVISRYLGLFEEITHSFTKVKMEHRIKEVLTTSNAKEFNQAIMDLGATICLPNSNAKCYLCPLMESCKAYQNDWVRLLPVKTKKIVKRHEKKTILILECNGKYALLKRPDKGLLSGLYQFPEMSYAKEKEDVLFWCKSNNYSVLSIEQLPIKKHVFTHLVWEMNGYFVKVMNQSDTFIWASQDELNHYSIPTAYSYYSPNKRTN